MVSLETAYQPISVLVLKPPFTDEISPRSSGDIRGMLTRIYIYKTTQSQLQVISLILLICLLRCSRYVESF